jgi:hypothetical protein
MATQLHRAAAEAAFRIRPLPEWCRSALLRVIEDLISGQLTRSEFQQRWHQINLTAADGLIELKSSIERYFDLPDRVAPVRHLDWRWGDAAAVREMCEEPSSRQDMVGLLAFYLEQLLPEPPGPAPDLPIPATGGSSHTKALPVSAKHPRAH